MAVLFAMFHISSALFAIILKTIIYSMKKNTWFVLLMSFSVINAVAQEAPVIKLVNPLKADNNVSTSKQFIIGSTCKTCSISINDQPVKVYSTGAFALALDLRQGDTAFNIVSTSSAGKSVSKQINFTYKIPPPADTVKTVAIAGIQTFPEGNLVLLPGDVIRFKVKALPGGNVSVLNNTMLYEMPVSQSGGMPGIYQGEYTIRQTDVFGASKMMVTLVAPDGQRATKETGNTFAVMSPLSSDVAITKGRLAHLEYGLGDDRLGGAKIGYLDSNVLLKVIGKVGADYKIKLADNKTAYIPDDLVSLMPKGTFAASSLTGHWRVYGDSAYDYVTVGLSARLPYQSVQQVNPSRIVVDVFGATNNTNWITQLGNTQEVANVDYEQVQNDIFRITIQLKHQQHWGHQVYYRGNLLVIKIKQQPKDLSLKNLTIAIDAGHGGTNTGAGGATGSSEKALALAVSLKLQKALEAEGAKVLMTRTTEKFVDNKDRILLFRDAQPDLLVSIHLNSAVDPFNAGGTSSLYRYVGFRPLSFYINKRMLELGLKEYGNIGSFNFMLNSPTEYPSALVETLFISNLEEEALILDEGFQQRMAEKIVLGVKDFLAATK
ncbi:N-acetylmuramoyl-L-alanine amidase [Ferruginibacter sp. HRS2-29]|nr:N-acetylmuramoyl-L-alanine amidase [Ferruginibacter sp. HRS2-29]